MKMKAFLVPSAALVLLLTCCCMNSAQAQSGSLSGSGGTVNTAKVEFCDIALPKLETTLKSEANATCNTQYACIECKDRASSLVIAATLVVQPEKADCKPAASIATQTSSLSRGGDMVQAPNFNASILQSPCFASGTNLEVYVAGYGTASREFTYLWEMDGLKGGHLPSIQCASGKTASVRVTQLATGASKTLVVTLNSSVSGE